MLNHWKHIAVFMDGSPEGERIGRRAAALAKRHGAHLVGAFGVSREDTARPADSYARGAGAIQAVIARRREEGETAAAAARQKLEALAHDFDIPAEFRVVWRDGLGDQVLGHLCCDLIVAAHPKPRDLPEGWSGEHLLLNNGGPLLLVPDAWSGERIGDRVMIAWNASAKARRAVNDSLPFLQDAGRVTIAIVDGDRDPDRYGRTPGADVQAHLARHGVTTEVLNLASEGQPVAEVVASAAIEWDADLIVIGAYSRSRMSQVMFGGVTRALLSRAPRPLFIAH